MDGTKRDPALAAPARLRPRRDRIERLVNLLEIRPAFGNRPLLRVFLRKIREFQHCFGHNSPPHGTKIPALVGGAKLYNGVLTGVFEERQRYLAYQAAQLP
jgi:hypothetical protein